MKRLLLACAILGLSWPVLASQPCKVKIHRHERHTSTADKKEAYQLAGIPWEGRGCCVVDHRIALEIGGLDELSNLQIQTKAEGKLKDRVENDLARRVCRGDITLKEAQRQVVNWRAYRFPLDSSLKRRK